MTLPDDASKIRSALEAYFAKGLEDVFKTYDQLNAVQFQKDTPRFEVFVAIGAATGSKKSLPDLGIIRYDAFNFTVQFTCVSRPGNIQQPDPANPGQFIDNPALNGLHEAMVGFTRNYAATVAQASWADTVNLPFHYIAEALRDTGSPSSTKPERGEETTKLSFAGIVGIRDTAWQ